MVLEWKKPIEFGDIELDAVHKQLFDWVVMIDEPTEEVGASTLSIKFLRGFNELLLELFPVEEALMKDIGYNNYKNHCEDHADVLEGIGEAILTLEQKRLEAIQKAKDFIIFSIGGHVETMDRPLAHFVTMEKARTPISHRRTGDGGGLSGPKGGRALSHAKPASAPASEGSQPNLRSLIFDTYTQALLVVKTERGLSGEVARAAACRITASTVSKLSGRKVTHDMVSQLLQSR